MTRNVISMSTSSGIFDATSTFMSGVDVARHALLVMSTPPFQTNGARKHAPNKHNNLYLYGVMISYGKCLVNQAQGYIYLSHPRKTCYTISMKRSLFTTTYTQRTPIEPYLLAAG